MLAVSGDVEELSDVNEHTLLNAISCSESSMTWVAPAALSGCHCSTHVSSMSRFSRRILLCLVTGPIERVDADPQIVTMLFFFCFAQVHERDRVEKYCIPSLPLNKINEVRVPIGTDFYISTVVLQNIAWSGLKESRQKRTQGTLTG